MTRKWAAGLILVVAACASATNQPSGRTSASSAVVSSSASPLPSASPGPLLSPAPSSSASELPLTKVDFACTLPIHRQVGTQLTDDFLTFPALNRTPAGVGGYYYDRAVSRWLPVGRQAVSPDGRRYAYTEGWSASPPLAPRVHIVDAATGADLRVATMPNAAPYSVIDFTDKFVYLAIRYEASPPGYWSVDPSTGAVAKASDGYYQRAGAGWSGAIDSRDPKPYQSPFNGELGNNRIDYRDAAGQTTTWFYRPGHSLHWVAFGGTLAVLVYAGWRSEDPTIGGIEYWLVTSPNQSAQIASYSYSQPSPYMDLMNGFFSAIADAHGIWVGGQQSLYLVKPNGVIQRVYGESAYPANGCF